MPRAGDVWYTYGIRRTTIYLPDDLKRDVERAARTQDRSEADVIRDAISAAVRMRETPIPRVPLSARGLGDPGIAERVDEALEGFGL
ncbi:MAG TPA: CopG family transcriptional regulator [Thermoanaerobaculia bacterium]|nr:CopG family transcriptional regulator [Thermoanaerobaculia bacterium]